MGTTTGACGWRTRWRKVSSAPRERELHPVAYAPAHLSAQDCADWPLAPCSLFGERDRAVAPDGCLGAGRTLAFVCGRLLSVHRWAPGAALWSVLRKTSACSIFLPDRKLYASLGVLIVLFLNSPVTAKPSLDLPGFAGCSSVSPGCRGIDLLPGPFCAVLLASAWMTSSGPPGGPASPSAQ
jgi:hypothetical protein